jgi:hypothetical protein
MSNVRHTILENLKTELAKITVANGYQTNIVSVSREFRSWENLSSDKFPCLFVLDDGRETVEEECGNVVFMNLYPAIVGYIKDKTDLQLAFGKLDSDLRNFYIRIQTSGKTASRFGSKDMMKSLQWMIPKFFN